MSPPSNSVMQTMAAIFVLFQVQIFVGILLTNGYSLHATLAAASVVGAISAEITARILGQEPGSLPPAASD